MYELLSKPPIVEAVLEIHVNPSPNLTTDKLKNPAKKLFESFPEQRTRREFEGQYQLDAKGEKVNQQTRQEITGYIYEERERKQILQFLKNRYAYNRLQPYVSWDDFVENARSNWENYYIGTAEPESITKLRLRFLNHLHIPTTEEPSAYVTTYPSLPDTINDTVNSFFYRIGLIDREGITSRAVHTLKPAKNEFQVILVIDNSVEMTIQTDPDNQEIWEKIEKLRSKKNQLFFELLTDRAIDLCK